MGRSSHHRADFPPSFVADSRNTSASVRRSRAISSVAGVNRFRVTTGSFSIAPLCGFHLFEPPHLWYDQLVPHALRKVRVPWISPRRWLRVSELNCAFDGFGSQAERFVEPGCRPRRFSLARHVPSPSPCNNTGRSVMFRRSSPSQRRKGPRKGLSITRVPAK